MGPVVWTHLMLQHTEHRVPNAEVQTIVIPTSLRTAFMLIALGALSSPTVDAQQVSFPVCQQLEDWAPQLAGGDTLGMVAGVAMDPMGRVVAFRRAGRPFSPVGDAPIDRPAVLILDPATGAVLSSWGEDVFLVPHGIAFDSQGNAWLTDTGLQQVLAFDADGVPILAVGQARVAGDDARHFDRPSGATVAEDGSFYVSDGYGNSRVMHFSAEGHLLNQWGVSGDGEAEFRLPHGIVLGQDGLVHVADRENSRIQTFDRTGRFIRLWDDPGLGRPYAMIETDPSSIWRGLWLVSSRSVAVDGRAWSRVNVVNPQGRVIGYFGERHGGPNVPLLGHGIAVASDGAVYLSGSQGLIKFECR